jgi:hypothetical protein
MNNSEVSVFLQHKLDQWETSIETFIRRQSEDELNKYIERLIHTLNDDRSPIDDALLAILALFGLTYVWMKTMRREDGAYPGEHIDD